jgi:hypothetical protein
MFRLPRILFAFRRSLLSPNEQSWHPLVQGTVPGTRRERSSLQSPSCPDKKKQFCDQSEHEFLPICLIDFGVMYEPHEKSNSSGQGVVCEIQSGSFPGFEGRSSCLPRSLELRMSIDSLNVDVAECVRFSPFALLKALCPCLSSTARTQ